MDTIRRNRNRATVGRGEPDAESMPRSEQQRRTREARGGVRLPQTQRSTRSRRDRSLRPIDAAAQPGCSCSRTCNDSTPIRNAHTTVRSPPVRVLQQPHDVSRVFAPASHQH